MKDIYEAIEQLSAQLSFRIDNVSRAKGWGTKPYSWIIAPAPERLCIIVATTLSLPEGLGASFTPRPKPERDGNSWPIDVRRSDALVRSSWRDGIAVVKDNKNWVLWYGSNMLTDQALDELVEDLGKI